MFRELAAGHPDRQAPGVNATGWPAQGPSVTDQRGANLRPCSRLDTDSTVSLAQSTGKNKENFIVYFHKVTSILGCPRPAPRRPDRHNRRCRKLGRGVGERWPAVPIYPLHPTGESFKKRTTTASVPAMEIRSMNSLPPCGDANANAPPPAGGDRP